MFAPLLSDADADGLFAALDDLLEDVQDIAGPTMMSESNSDSDSVHQQSRSPDNEHHHAKKHKVTYYQRKDEIGTLKDEAAALEDMLRRMKAANASGSSGQRESLQDLYQEDIRRTNLQSAGAQALLSSYQSTFSNAPALVPTAIYLHLPVDNYARVNLLTSMREQKLRTAMRFMAERSRFLDLNQRHRQLDNVELPNGDFVSSGLELVQFKSGHSVRQVFGQFLHFASDQDASLPENVGILATREGSHQQDLPFNQLVATLLVREGFSFECNLVMYSMCVDGVDGHPGYALATIDFVDQDELHPYHPDMFGRKELTASFLLTEIFTPKGRIVSMACWSHVSYRPPRREITEAEKEAVRTDNGKWRQSMPTVIRKSLARYLPAI